MARVERLYGLAQIEDSATKSSLEDVDRFLRDTNESLGGLTTSAAKGFSPGWTQNTVYQTGELAYLDGVLWRANTEHCSAASLAANILFWDAVGVGYPLALVTERIIGRNWANDLPIYDQAFQITLDASTGTSTRAHSITSLDTDGFTEFVGNASGSTPRLYPWSPYAAAGGVAGVLWYADATNFVFDHQNAVHNSAVVNAVLRYQKT